MELLKIFKNKNNEFKIFFKDKCVIKEYSIEKGIQYNYKNYFQDDFVDLKKMCYQSLLTENNKNEIIEMLKEESYCMYVEKTTEYVLSTNNYKNKNFEKDPKEIEIYLNSLKLEKKSYKEIELYEFLFSEECERLKNSKTFLDSNKYYIKKMWKELLK